MEQTFKWHSYPLEEPQKNGCYLVTRMGKVDFDNWITITIKTKTDNWEHSFWEHRGIITAWAEIPEPYKEGTENE